LQISRPINVGIEARDRRRHPSEFSRNRLGALEDQRHWSRFLEIVGARSWSSNAAKTYCPVSSDRNYGPVEDSCDGSLAADPKRSPRVVGSGQDLRKAQG
jgi:hypothetical protein